MLGLLGTSFSPNCPFPFGDRHPPLNTLFIGSSPLIMSNGMSIGSSVFVCVPNAMLYSGEENPFPAIGDAAYCQRSGGGPSHGHRQYAQKIWQRSCMWFWRYPCRQTDRLTHTHHNTLQLLPWASNKASATEANKKHTIYSIHPLKY